MVEQPGPVLIVVERSSSFYAQVAAGLGSALSADGVQLMIHLWGEPGGSMPRSLVRLLHEGGLSGVVTTAFADEAAQAALHEELQRVPDLPVVSLGVPVGACSLRADNALGMQLIARHVVGDCGARRPLVVRGIEHQVDSAEREEVLLAELARLGVRDADVRVVTGSFDRECSLQAVRRALAEGPAPDAVLAFNDHSALGAADALREAGLRVPEDVVITGFDDGELARLCRPALTTVTQQPFEQGARAADLLRRLAAGERPGHQRMPVLLVQRASTALRPGPAPDDAAVADELWQQVSRQEATLATSRALTSCRTVEEVVDQLRAGLRQLGVLRGSLVLAGEDERQSGEALVISLPDGRESYYRFTDRLDARMCRPARRPGEELLTVVVRPLTAGDRELGLLILERDATSDGYVPEALALDLIKVLDAILRTRRLEAEVAARRAAQEALTRQWHHDPLTGLMNRTAFASRTDAVLAASPDAAALLLVDVDRFKDVNESLGHAVGDAVLREVGARLAELVGEGGNAFRLGADEFAVLAPGAGTPVRAMAVARAVLDTLRERFTLDGVTLDIEASIGVACPPAEGCDAESLLHMADLALYQAKSERAGAALYHPDLQAEAPRRLALFGELRRAINQRELVVHYQPITEMSTGRVTGAEALVRWAHPTLGLLAPGDFLEVAEQTGLIHPITSYVLDQALRDCRRWRDQGIALRIAVNLSVRRLVDAELADEVARLLVRHGVPASCLELEVTESAAMADPARALSVLESLRNLGVHLSVDDFGTGHASLAYLSRLPVSALKIDRSFVLTMESDVANHTIVRSILDLARNLGLGVIAEGIETSSAYDALAALGLVKAQGYWLARPAPAADIPRLIAEIEGRLADRPDEAAFDGLPRPRPQPAADVARLNTPG